MLQRNVIREMIIVVPEAYSFYRCRLYKWEGASNKVSFDLHRKKTEDVL